jgi:hypothetical protein
VKPAAKSHPNASYLEDGLKLNDQSLADLEAEIARYQQMVNVDRTTAERYAAISKKIDAEKLALEHLTTELEDCEGAKARAVALAIERETTYQSVFEAVLSEQQVLLDLYKPLMERLQAASETLKKLSFSPAPGYFREAPFSDGMQSNAPIVTSPFAGYAQGIDCP